MNKDELQLILEEGEGYRIEFKESKAGLPPIKFEFDNFFTVTFERPIRKEISFFSENDKLLKTIDDTINDTINEPINEVVKKRLIKEILYIAKYGFITRAVIESISKISIATAKRDVFLLKKMGFIKFKGARKTGKYILSDKGKKILDSITLS